MAAGLGVVAAFIVLAACFSYYSAKQLRIWYLIDKFPGPPAIPILGNIHRTKREPRASFIQAQVVMNDFRKTSGGIFRLWMGSAPLINIFGAKHMEVILSSSQHLTKGFFYKFLEPWLGKGLLTSTGQKWFHRRKLLTPTFHFSILQNFMEVFNEQSSILVEKLGMFADTDNPVNICPHITNCVLDIICDTAMGKHINAQGTSGGEYVKAVLRMSDVIVQRGKAPWIWSDFAFERSNYGKEQKRSLKILHDMTNKMIQERLREPPQFLNGDIGKEDLGIKQKKIAFLDLLLQMHREDKGFTLEDIREEVDTFMFEGHDTTAAAVNWALLQIGLHPDVQSRLHKEIDDVFGDSDRPVTSDDLSKLSYLNCVVKEALRMVPSVPIIVRTLNDDIILDGKIVPKEAIIVLNIYGLHQDPEYYPDPERFDPDRFLPENLAKRHPYAYIPFSAGPRNCIGQKFALMEDKVILINILRKFKIESMQSLEEANISGQLIIRPVDGKLFLKFNTRK